MRLLSLTIATNFIDTYITFRIYIPIFATDAEDKMTVSFGLWDFKLNISYDIPARRYSIHEKIENMETNTSGRLD